MTTTDAPEAPAPKLKRRRSALRRRSGGVGDVSTSLAIAVMVRPYVGW
jgi:hypothetical protein